MIDPVTLAITGGLLTGGGGLISSYGERQGQRKMTEEKRKQIEAIIAKLEKDWQTPEYDMSPITLEEYKVLQDYVPEIAPLVEERFPKLVEETGARPYIRAQEDALRKLQQQSVTGDDAISRAGRERALSEADAREASMRQAALSRMQSAGLGTAEGRMAAELGAAGDAAGEARQRMLQEQAQAQSRRSEAMLQAAGLAGTLREGAWRKEATVADAINSFNQRATARRQAHLTNAAQTRNQAQQFNQGQRQNAFNMNVQQRNALQQSERARRDMIAQSLANNQNQLLSTTTGLQGQVPIQNQVPWWADVAKATSAAGAPIMTAGLTQMVTPAAPTVPTQPTEASTYGLGADYALPDDVANYSPTTLAKPKY